MNEPVIKFARTRESSEVAGAPLIKWPGGKRWLANFMCPLLKSKQITLIEPFAGGAAFFSRLKPAHAALSDINPSLITTYSQIRDNVDNFTEALRLLPNSESEYYRIRNKTPKTDLEIAIRFYYLNQLAFNGIYRENLAGDFNVPYGKKTKLVVCNPDRIKAFSQILQTTSLSCCSYESVLSATLPQGSLIFIDPPYVTDSRNSGFVKYNSHLFSWPDQVKLAKMAQNCCNNGCQVIVTNSVHESIVNLYSGFYRIVTERYSSVSALSAHRGPVRESLFIGGSGASELYDEITSSPLCDYNCHFNAEVI